MTRKYKYTVIAIGVILIIEALLIYISRDQINFNWWRENAEQQSPPEVVKDDPYIDLINQGNGYLADSDYEDAAKSFDAAIALDPNRPEAYTSESIVATGTEELDLLNLALSKGSYGYAFEFRANYYTHLGKYDLALADANKAIETGVFTYRVYEYRASDYLTFRKYAEALSDSQEAIRLNPDDSQALVLKGLALYGLGICQDATYAFNDAVELSKGGEFEVDMRNEFVADFNQKVCVDESSNSDRPQTVPTTTTPGSDLESGERV